jgi:iron complex outermembrane recepter protein
MLATEVISMTIGLSRIRRFWLFTCIVGLTSLIESRSSFAQPASGTQLDELIEEIIVMARRREEVLQDTPIAISAFTGQSLEYRGITQLDEISAYVPNLTLQNNPGFSGSSNVASIYIRGVGQKEFLPTTEPGVGLYMDEVYIARSVGAVLDLMDISQVEVLRGPQGTLFGRNTIGGAVIVSTVKPLIGVNPGAKVSAAVGSDNRINLRGSLDYPLGDTAAMRVALGSFQQDGYVRRTDGADLGNDDTLTGRVAVAWKPADNFSMDLSLDATRDRENAPPMELLAIDFSDLSHLAGLVSSVPPPMVFIHNITMAALGPGMPCAATDSTGNGVTSNPGSPNCYDTRYIFNDSRTASNALKNPDTDILGIGSTITWDLSDQLTLKSISGWRDLDTEFGRDSDHSPYRISEFYDKLSQQQFTQELQLLGSGDRYNWIIGGYYFAEDGDNRNLLDFTVSSFQSGGRFDSESKAIFAQLTFDLTDVWHLTLGGRQTQETKKFQPDQFINKNHFAGISQQLPPGHPLAALDAPFLQAGTRILPYVEKAIDIEEFTPTFNISYDVSDDIMVYAGYSEGFKSGGFTQRVFPPLIPGFTAPTGTSDVDLIPEFQPEFVDSIEFGIKLSLAGGRLRMNGALFTNDYDSLQVQVFNSVAPVTQNIGAATMQGAEFELQAVLEQGWLIDANISYLNAQYDEIATQTTLIKKSYEFERVPEWASHLGISKDVYLNPIGAVTFRIDWSYRDETFNDAYNSPILKTDAYDRIDVSLRWTDASEQWSVLMVGRNLSNEKYMVTGVHSTAFQTYEAMFDRGRQWYIELSRDI